MTAEKFFESYNYLRSKVSAKDRQDRMRVRSGMMKVKYHHKVDNSYERMTKAVPQFQHFRISDRASFSHIDYEPVRHFPHPKEYNHTMEMTFESINKKLWEKLLRDDPWKR